MEEKKRNSEDVNLANENEEVETILEEFEEAKGSVYRQAANERAIVSFTLGILSILFIWLFVFASPVIGAVGTILGVQARAEAKKSSYGSNSIAVIGLVCSIVALAVSIIKILYVFVL